MSVETATKLEKVTETSFGKLYELNRELTIDDLTITDRPANIMFDPEGYIPRSTSSMLYVRLNNEDLEKAFGGHRNDYFFVGEGKTLQIAYNGIRTKEKKLAKLNENSVKCNEYVDEHYDELIARCLEQMKGKVQGAINHHNKDILQRAKDNYSNVDYFQKEWFYNNCDSTENKKRLSKINEKLEKLEAEKETLEESMRVVRVAKLKEHIATDEAYDCEIYRKALLEGLEDPKALGKRRGRFTF